MSKVTDPAREFTDFCQTVAIRSEQIGGQFLAATFKVQPWQTDFMLILASVHQRITNLHAMVLETDLDDDLKQSANNSLDTIRNAFAQPGLVNKWSYSVENYLSSEILMPVRMASAYVREHHGYIVPDTDGAAELVAQIEELIDWLKTQELAERDFIRTALIEGLTGFLLRVRLVGWFGWHDTIESLKAVIAAYLALERGLPDANVSPPYDAMVKKVGSLLQTVFERVKFAKEVQETGDWLLRGYGALQVVGQAYTGIAGLLPHG